jgi:hypothetical protein
MALTVVGDSEAPWWCRWGRLTGAVYCGWEGRHAKDVVVGAILDTGEGRQAGAVVVGAILGTGEGRLAGAVVVGATMALVGKGDRQGMWLVVGAVLVQRKE